MKDKRQELKRGGYNFHKDVRGSRRMENCCDSVHFFFLDLEWGFVAQNEHVYIQSIVCCDIKRRERLWGSSSSSSRGGSRALDGCLK